jgi:hypothetical protein
MNAASTPDLFRQAAEAENGMPISAGARVAHVRAAVQAGRALYIDLSAVPEDQRATLIDQINQLVGRASKTTSQAPSQTSGPSRGV